MGVKSSPSSHNSNSDLDIQVDEILGYLKINKPPIDVYKAITDLRFMLSFHCIPSGKLGACYRFAEIPDCPPSILISHLQLWSRKRFTAAHELKHAVYDTGYDSRTSPPDEIKEIEKDANLFASRFLVPEYMLEKLRSETDRLSVRMIADTFGVSYEAAYYRLGGLEGLDYRNPNDREKIKKIDKEIHKNFQFSMLSAHLDEWQTLKMSYSGSYMKRPLCIHCGKPQINEKPNRGEKPLICWCCGKNPFLSPSLENLTTID